MNNRILFLFVSKLIFNLFLSVFLLSACKPSTDIQSQEPQTNSTPNEHRMPIAKSTYSYFGEYQPLPDWSDWCGAQTDPILEKECVDNLQIAVEKPNSKSRMTVRSHAWKLWAAASIPIDDSGYDSTSDTSRKYGVSGCWARSSEGQTACSGVFPLWLTWPNTGVPFSHQKYTETQQGGLLKINRSFTAKPAKGEVLIVANNSPAIVLSTDDPDPTKVQTVNTYNPTGQDPIPTYLLPPLTLVKQCGLLPEVAKTLLNKAYNGQTQAERNGAWNDLDLACIKNKFAGVVCPKLHSLCDGNAFVNQGDVMIATESVSVEAWNSIQNNQLYGGTDTLVRLYNQGKDEVAADKVPSWIDKDFISTKHMYWPVKGCQPGSKAIGEKGCRVRYGALPPWIPKNFKDKNLASNAEYLGYERWGQVVAIDTCGEKNCPVENQATLKLEQVLNATAITTTNPDVYSVNQFIHLQVSKETLENAFTPADRALLDQATIWAYGEDSNGFEAGDFLVVAAMHIITKEIPSWAFQSVWWSPMTDRLQDCPLAEYGNCFGQTTAYQATSNYSGLSEKEITEIDNKVGDTWRSNYLLSDSYGINYEIDGTPTDVNQYFPDKPPIWATQKPTGEKINVLPVAMNVYIEPVIHPLGTNCQNCHRRAGVLLGSAKSEYSEGVAKSNYQTSQCPSLLGDYGMPASDSCMMKPWAWNQSAIWNAPPDNNCVDGRSSGVKCKGKEAFPIVNTDLSWFIADGHVQGEQK